MKIANVTQHNATHEQIAQGVEQQADDQVKTLLNFATMPTLAEIQAQAEEIAEIVATQGHKKAMIAGAPFFMSSLEAALKEKGIQPLYAFSVRESIEKQNEDGSVTKTNVFRHIGFVEV